MSFAPAGRKSIQQQQHDGEQQRVHELKAMFVRRSECIRLRSRQREKIEGDFSKRECTGERGRKRQLETELSNRSRARASQSGNCLIRRLPLISYRIILELYAVKLGLFVSTYVNDTSTAVDLSTVERIKYLQYHGLYDSTAYKSTSNREFIPVIGKLLMSICGCDIWQNQRLESIHGQ